MKTLNLTVTIALALVFIMAHFPQGNLSAATITAAEIIDFENITTSSFKMDIEAADLKWNGFGVVNSNAIKDYRTGTVSGDYVAFNWDNLAPSIGGEWFYLDGFFATSVSDEALMLTLTGQGENEIYIKTYEINNSTATWIDPGIWVNELIFSTGLPDITISLRGDLRASTASFFSIDDVAISRTNPVPTPEPNTMLLFGIGLLGLSRLAQKKVLLKA